MKTKSACFAMLALTACTSQGDGAASDRQRETAAEHPKVALAQESERFTSREDAAAAWTVVARYFALLDKKHYAEALSLWTPDGQKAFRGRPADLATQYEHYSRFHGIPASISSIETGVSKDNIVVPATAEVTLRRDGTQRTIHGWVYLHRSSGSQDSEWKIRGVDIRKPLDD